MSVCLYVCVARTHARVYACDCVTKLVPLPCTSICPGDQKERGQIPLDFSIVVQVPEDMHKKTVCFVVSTPSNNGVFVLQGRSSF